jgi:hypothetical protein
VDVRNLIILNINDRPVVTFVTGKAAAKHFDVYQVASWEQVQLLLSGQSSVPPPDLLLLDVSFDMDYALRGAAVHGTDNSVDTLVPVGPVLALPFLNSRPVMGFAPYSAHMENAQLKQHPPFLVAMGLIAAKMRGGSFSSRYLSMTEANESLDDFINKLEAAGNPNKGLEMALPMYRKNIKKAVREGRFFVLNSRALIANFEQLKAELEDRLFDKPDDDQYIDVPAGMHLETIDKLGNHDKISILSLFADKLQWRHAFLDADGVDWIRGWLYKIAEIEPCFTRAVAVIKAQNAAQVEDPCERRPRVDWMIRQLYGDASDDDRREIFRLCVLFANVHAWSVNQGISLERKEVYQRLGFSDTPDTAPRKTAGKVSDSKRAFYNVDQTIYQSWFGARSRTSGNLAPIVARNTVSVMALPPIDPERPIGDIDRYFLNKGTVISIEDSFLIRNYRKLFEVEEEESYGSWTEPYKVRREI